MRPNAMEPERAAMNTRPDRPTISASELADYVFCARSWWLKRVGGVKPVSASLHSGVVAHQAVGAKVETAVGAERTVHRLTWLLFALALLALAVLSGLVQ